MGKRSLLVRCLIVLCALLLIGNVGWIVRNNSDAQQVSTTQMQRKKYPLLARRVLGDNPNDILINFVALRKQLEPKFAALSVQKSFYFEYLPDGTSIRVGDDSELVAASLIKLPLVMNLYRAAELGDVDLNKTVAIAPSEVDDAYGDLYKKGAGYHLTLREAARLALEDSDNTAAHVVYDAANGLLSYDQQSLAQLDIDQTLQQGQAVISAKSYSSILKSLYFSAYLSKGDSQELLGYLTHSSATNRLTKQLPKDVLVAHKIGVNNTAWSESDCGIVYVPKRPYMICVMVGLPDDQANAFIADISKQVYDYVSQQQ